ncbi:AraC family transcriptional regulator [uncultured Aquimarina sp.]|uniref:helix-turn-helix domain-containing protein n=1 Tax=uncultured Aquimarina sp. TaxID=575652 RepID=UPI002632BC6F|nr:AraC family transcriptional regulator [uncultured Aquimarina sp.]
MMNFENQLLFFFSALGAFNGLFLSLYFAFFIKNRNRTTYFLAALLFVISVRVTKSVFLTFYPDTSSAFVTVGLTACFLIGPFLYLYTRIATKPDSLRGWYWLLHIIPVIIFMITIGILFPYREYSELWWRLPPRIFGTLLFLQWTIYVIAAIFQAKESFRKLFSKSEKVNTQNFWILNIVIGGFLIWLAYNTTMYTSYIVGALSFSFTFYITLVIWFFKRRENALSFLTPTVKYANKKIENSKVASISYQLEMLFKQKEVHLNPSLKLSEVASHLQITPHALSQYLNDNVGVSFSNYINAYRIASAEKMLQCNDTLTLEAIGNECGFKSNSSFYAAFKKIKGVTPAQFKKSLK